MKFNQEIQLGTRMIGHLHKPYIIAEMSCNHNGDKEVALALVRAAAVAGADAVKLQTYTADTMTIDCDKPDFLLKGGLWDGMSIYKLYEKAHTPWEWTADLVAEAQRNNLAIFSSPFDETAVDFLERFNLPAYKIASLELTDDTLLTKVAGTGRPIILSTGLASIEEVRHAVEVLRNGGCSEIILLHCISGYPTDIKDANIAAIPMLIEEFDLVTGLSDHSVGTTAATGAIALGARVIEKHMVLDSNDGSLDAAFSLEPTEFKTLVNDCQMVYQALGSSIYDRIDSEEVTRGSRRSLYIVEDIPEGGTLTTQNLRRIRPGFGMKASRFNEMLGRKVNKSLERGDPLCDEDVDA